MAILEIKNLVVHYGKINSLVITSYSIHYTKLYEAKFLYKPIQIYYAKWDARNYPSRAQY